MVSLAGVVFDLDDTLILERDYVSSGYAHQSKVVVKAGQKVKQGDIVGYVGTTGLSTGCHLHLQVYRDGTRVNPMKYL